MKTPRRAILALLLALSGAAVLGGCKPEVLSVSQDPWLKFGPPSLHQQSPGNNSNAVSLPESSGYTILLQTFSGTYRMVDARRFVHHLQDASDLTDLWLFESGDKIMLNYGRYPSPNDPLALNDLRETRNARVDGYHPFADAQIAAFGKNAKPLAGAADLRQFVGTKDLYTLQVAFFNADGGPNFREAAEIYCRQLRGKQQKAYFYHGPHYSMVTVGLFHPDDFVPAGPSGALAYGPRIKELQKLFPYNLGNGMTLKDINKVNGHSETQPSFLVAVPDQ